MRSSSPRDGRRHGQRHVRRVRHQLRRAAGRSEGPDLAAARPEPAAGCRSPVRSACSRASSPPCARGGASRCGWRSTDEPPSTTHARPAHLARGEPGGRGVHDGRRTTTRRPLHAAASPSSSSATPRRPPAPPRHRSRDIGQLPAVLRPDGDPAVAGPDAVRQPRCARSRSAAASSPGCRPTRCCSAPEPGLGQIEGFDIDLLHAVSQAIFGDPNRSSYKVITPPSASRPCRTAPSTSWRAT